MFFFLVILEKYCLLKEEYKKKNDRRDFYLGSVSLFVIKYKNWLAHCPGVSSIKTYFEEWLMLLIQQKKSCFL